MPKPAKEKPTHKSAKNRKPYLRVQVPAARGSADTQDGNSGIPVAEATEKLKQMFNELVPDDVKKERKLEDFGDAEPIGVGPSLAYIQRLGADPESYEMFVVLEVVQENDFGTITRDSFVKGWTRVFQESEGRVTPEWSAQEQFVRSRIKKVATDPAQFKALYDRAFEIGREPGQKSLKMVFAVDFWQAFFGPATHPWRTANVDWLETWKEYLGERFGVLEENKETKQVELVDYKRTVSKDLWSQTRLFATKTMEDGTLGFWSEEQAWPGLIDEFVIWCREKGIVGGKNGERVVGEE